MADYNKYLDPDVLARISRLELRARTIVEGFVSGMHKSPYQGYSVEFAAHREYVPGDDIRHIDWRLFGRADRLYIKQYEEETNLRTHVLLDCSRSMAYPEHTRGWRNKYDYAATLAASLTHLLVNQQDTCGLVLFDDDIREQIAPSSRTAQLYAMIEAIERHPPNGATEVRAVFGRLAEQLRQRGLVVLISDLLGNLGDLLDGLQRLRYAGHDVIVLHVLDDEELTFPFDGNTMFEGLEPPPGELLVDPQALRTSYLAILGDFINRVRSACMGHKIDYHLLSTHDPLEASLTAYLAARMHRTSR